MSFANLIRVSAFGFVLLACLGGCNDDDDEGGDRLVGGACQDSGDCVERCVRGGEWPGGMCTVNCRDDYDCPGGTACIEDEGGICAISCGGDGDCGMIGDGWECRSRDREGHPGSVSVCRGD